MMQAAMHNHLKMADSLPQPAQLPEGYHQQIGRDSHRHCIRRPARRRIPARRNANLFMLDLTEQEHIMEGDSLTLGNLVSIAQRLSVTIVGDAEALIGVCRKAGKGGANHE
ncbi:MAG: hypothetical protein R3E93_09740 [Thiothrix sp.]